MQARARRRVHSPELKRTVIAECGQPGASVSAVSLAHGLNANLVRKWLHGRGVKTDGESGPTAAARPMKFMPVALAGADDALVRTDHACHAPADIHIELRRGSAQMAVRWPSSQAGGCASWLRELTGLLLK